VREIPYLVPVIAGDYLKKRWCLSELLGFFESKRCEEVALRKYAVVATVPNHIDDLLVRAGHAREAEGLVRSMLDEGGAYLDPKDFEQCQKLVGHSRTLASVLRALADDLGDRGLTEATAAKVVEMLTDCFQKNQTR